MAKKINKPKYVGVQGLEVLEGASNYNSWIASNFIEKLEPPLLEIGAGTGNISKHFLFKTPLYISEIDEYFLSELKKKFGKNRDVFVEKFDIDKSPPKKFKSFFKTIVGVNVLEHIEDDDQALKNLKTSLKSGGRLMLLVPAKKWAFTRLDKELRHFRRYEKKELKEKIEKSGFEVEEVYFFNILGLLSWKVRDRVGERVYIPQDHVKIFDLIVPFLKILESVVQPPLGISLVIIARKT